MLKDSRGRSGGRLRWGWESGDPLGSRPERPEVLAERPEVLAERPEVLAERRHRIKIYINRQKPIKTNV